MKRYWLVLYPDTFLWLKNSLGIIYNSKNYKHFTFICRDKLKKLCKTLIDLNSLYSVELTEKLLCRQNIKEWVKKIIQIDAGEIIEQDKQEKKLVSYFPTLTIQNNIDHIRWKDGLNMGGEIIKNLEELIFYINGSPNGSKHLYKQLHYPLKTALSVNFELVDTFIKKCKNAQLNKITFIGDLCRYHDLDKLQKWVHSNNYFLHFILLPDDIVPNIEKFKWLFREKTDISIIANDYTSLPNQFDLFRENSDMIKWLFPVTSVVQFEWIDSFIRERTVKEYEIVPVFDGSNLPFFEANVYTSQEDFNEISLSRREVFINMTLNVNHFGKLTILPDKKVYASVNENPLGNIKATIYDILFKEMTKGHSWLKVRNKRPCNKCVYQWLCPSPGNYEKVIGKPNLCHINQSREDISATIVNS